MLERADNHCPPFASAEHDAPAVVSMMLATVTDGMLTAVGRMPRSSVSG
jgi:hypothetical protein